MIVDTSALVAVLRHEQGHEPIRDALLRDAGFIPTPVLVEFHRVTRLIANAMNPNAVALLQEIMGGSIRSVDFNNEAAQAAVIANALYGSGNGRGGRLNMLDLMVYGTAQVTNRPILCTGKEFAATDAAIHPASRGW